MTTTATAAPPPTCAPMQGNGAIPFSLPPGTVVTLPDGRAFTIAATATAGFQVTYAGPVTTGAPAEIVIGSPVQPAFRFDPMAVPLRCVECGHNTAANGCCYRCHPITLDMARLD